MKLTLIAIDASQQAIAELEKDINLMGYTLTKIVIVAIIALMSSLYLLIKDFKKDK